MHHRRRETTSVDVWECKACGKDWGSKVAAVHCEQADDAENE